MAQTAIKQRSGFDPGAWLAAFQRQGGYWFNIGDNVTLGVLLDGDETAERAARQMLAAVRIDADTRQAIRAYLLANAGEV